MPTTQVGGMELENVLRLPISSVPGDNEKSPTEFNDRNEHDMRNDIFLLGLLW